MVDFMNVTTEAWEESLFDCEATSKGKRQMDEMARRYQAQRLLPDEEPLVIQDTEDEYGVEVIGSGKTRVVIDLPDKWHRGTSDCIAKIQWDPHYHQTSGEITVWENANGRTAALLAPILDHSDMNQWLIMPEATLHTELTVKQTSTISSKLQNKLSDQGYRASDIRAANVGRIMNRDVVIDYGQLSKR